MHLFLKRTWLTVVFSAIYTFSIDAQGYSNKNMLPQPTIFDEGVISTSDYETHPAFSPSGDTLYLLKCLADANFCTICVSYHSGGKWTIPQVVSFSGQYNDADPFVTKDGKTVYFVSNRPLQEGGTAKEDWDIWKVERNATGWSKPTHLDSPISSEAGEYFPTLADNGNLYFGSSREGGKGKSDIYVSKFINGKYTDPVNLGDSINTTDNEYEPFIAIDESYMIFMATKPDGIAHADFFISYNIKDKWSKAEKLAGPINSPATEWGGKGTRDGKYFFFGSSRNKIDNRLPQRESTQQYEKRLNSAGNGLGDIYQVDIAALHLKAAIH